MRIISTCLRGCTDWVVKEYFIVNINTRTVSVLHVADARITIHWMSECSNANEEILKSQRERQQKRQKKQADQILVVSIFALSKTFCRKWVIVMNELIGKFDYRKSMGRARETQVKWIVQMKWKKATWGLWKRQGNISCWEEKGRGRHAEDWLKWLKCTWI